MLNTKQCSCCKKFKSISEFYKQGQRHESLCKDCKKLSRKNRNKNENENVDTQKNKYSELKKTDLSASSESKNKNISDRITLPNYDESLFIFNEERKYLKISDDDMDLVVSFFRWHFEQSKKRKKTRKVLNEKR